MGEIKLKEIERTNVPNIRLSYRHETLVDEHAFILKCLFFNDSIRESEIPVPFNDLVAILNRSKPISIEFPLKNQTSALYKMIEMPKFIKPSSLHTPPSASSIWNAQHPEHPQQQQQLKNRQTENSQEIQQQSSAISKLIRMTVLIGATFGPILLASLFSHKKN